MADDKISPQELSNIRQNIRLILKQSKSGRIDGPFLAQQIEKMDAVLEKVQEEYQQARQITRYEALYNVSRLLGLSLELQTVLDQVMDAVLQLTGAERGFLMLQDQDGGLEVKAARNLDQQTLDSGEFKYSRTIANTVLDSGEAVVTTNATEDPRFAGQSSIVSQSLRSIMATPLLTRGKVIGVTYVDSRVMTGLFDENDLDALKALGGQAAIAIENARLFEQTDQELASTVETLTELRRIDRQLNETLDADTTIQITLKWACRLAGVSKGHFGLVEGNPPIVRAIHHFGMDADEEEVPEQLDRSFPRVSEAIQTVAPITSITPAGERILIVPIPRENTVLGVVALRGGKMGDFTEQQVDLAQRVVNRAAVAIENARLYAAVQAADRAKSEFVGIVAHDLKVPMTSITGYAHLTRMIGEEHNNLVDRQDEFLEKISDTVKRMEVLVSDLADISRIESGHFFMEPIVVNVDQLIQTVKDNTLMQIKERSHTLKEEIQPNLPDLYVDYYRLLQVLTNLTSNAYKYTPNGGTITLAAALEGNRVRFTVSDTGIGLSESQIAMLGTKFWRAEDTYTRSQPGTGLGFAITASLVEQMGDKIRITSEVGKGSSFSFHIEIAS